MGVRLNLVVVVYICLVDMQFLSSMYRCTALSPLKVLHVNHAQINGEHSGKEVSHWAATIDNYWRSRVSTCDYW